MKKLAVIFTLFFVLQSVEVETQVLFQPTNLNFEKGLLGLKPPSWTFPRKIEEAGNTAELSNENPAEGEFCLLLNNPNKDTDGNPELQSIPVYQVIDCLPYQGKKIKISVKARFESSRMTSQGELWAIGRSTKENITFSKYTDDKPIVTSIWQSYQLIIDIPLETNELRFGVLLKGFGKLWADDFRIEVIQPDGAKDEPSKKYDARTLNNLKIFAKVYGYFNFFSPANNLSYPDNEMLTLWAISNVENAKNDKELLSILNKYAKATSPLSVINDKKDTSITYSKPSKAIDYLALVKQYSGGPIERPDDIFSTTLKNVFAANRKREGSLSQDIEVLKYKSKKLKVSSSIKVDRQSPGANAQIWIRADRIGSKESVAATSIETPAMSNVWKRYDAVIDLPQDVYTIKIALVFIGEGKASFDDVRIEVIDNNKKSDEITLPNSSFEQLGSDKFPINWAYDQAVVNAGYKLFVDSSSSTKGRYCISIESEKENRIEYPVIGKFNTYPLSENLYLHHTLVYFANDSGTVPKANLPKIELSGKTKGYNPNPADRLTRVATVIKLWNLIKHFSLSDIDLKNFDIVLEKSIEAAAESENDFSTILNKLAYYANDTRAKVWNLNTEYEFSLPFIIRELDGKFLISTVVDSTLGIEIGDEVLSVNRIPMNKYISEKTAIIAGNNNNFKMTKALAELRSGAKGSKEDFVIRKKSGAEINVSAVRKFMLQNIYEPKPMAIYELDSGIVYIDLTDMSDTRFKEFIEPLAQRHSFIFDLRGMTGMSEHFLGLLQDNPAKNAIWEVPVYTNPDKENISTIKFGGDFIKPKSKLSNKKFIFLVDERTSGYAEAIASIVKENKIAPIMGSKTSGNPTEVYAVRLFGGYSISMSGLNVISPNGTNLFNNPVAPDIEEKFQLQSKDEKYDSLIEKAFKFLKK